MATNKNHKLSLVVSGNDCSKLEIRQRIMEATLGLNKGYYVLMTERMSVNNADILAKFVISNRKEKNIAINTVISYIDGISCLDNFHKHKDLDKMDKNDIISFLDSYRKPENIDPLHRWINTYNLRLTVVCKFFRWLYSSKFNGLTAGASTTSSTTIVTPPIVSGIKRLNRKEKKYGRMKTT